jgi:formylglycine-generating enzyme required for sulfatase activity/uncharacterized caspase-like protein
VEEMASKLALVIANTEYQDASFAKLTAPGKDAEEFAQVLREPEFADFDDVQVLLNEEESKIRRAIARFFVNRQRDDLLLLYFSGHGMRNDQGQLFLAANDTEISILDATGIPADFVTHAMNNSRSQRQLLILDCCNSGAFAHGSKSASALGKSMGIANAFEGSGFGRVVLTATDATQYAWEGDTVIGNTQKSVFTLFLIEGLKGEADRDGDGRIHVDELYDYAYEQVVRRTPKQTPGKWSYKQQGDLVLRENLKPRDVKPAPLPSDLLELLSHPNSGVRKVGVQDLISLLEGKHLGLTRAAEEKLREIAAHDDSFTLRKTASDTLMAHGLVIEEPTPIPIATPPPIKAKPTVFREEKTELEREQSPKPVPHSYPISLNTMPWRFLGLVAVGLLIISFLIWGASKLLQNSPTITPEPTRTLQTNVTSTSQPFANAASQPEQTNMPTQTSILPTPTLGIGSTMFSDKDGMILFYVPAGEFRMGSDSGDADEKPVHTVTLDAFWIDQTKVTNAMYAKCVNEGKCDPPSSINSSTRDSYYGNADYDNYPVIYVDWNMAKTYCEWADRRLPTEAEWEKAARGESGRTYPWGNEAPNNNLLNYNRGYLGDTTEVGKYPDGASPYGALDMAGNVWEWVADWYDNSYYGKSQTLNPPGPISGADRVLRGGTWSGNDNGVRSALRSSSDPSDRFYAIGFRCASSP